MVEIIPPRRDEVLTPQGSPTKRFSEYLESITSTVNEDLTTVINQQASALLSQVGTLQAIVSELSKDKDNLQIFTASGIILPSTDVVLISGTNVILTMPERARKRVTIKKTDTGNATLDTPGPELIEGFSTATITGRTATSAGASHTYLLIGTEWRIL